MKRYLVMLVAAVALVWAASAQAATFSADPNASKVSVKLGALAGIPILHEGPGTASLTGNSTPMTTSDDIWSTVGFGPGTSLFTGVPVISHLQVTFRNLSETFDNRAGTAPIAVNTSQVIADGEITGTGAGDGQAFIYFLSGAKTPVNISKAGIGGTTTNMLQGAGQITITFDRWWTGSHNITSITSNIVQLPNRVPPESGVAFDLNPTQNEEVKTRTTLGGFITSNPNGVLSTVKTVAISGSFSVAASGTGTVTLVTPLRVNTNDLVGKIPGIVRQKFSFVPEPGTVLLLVSGSIGLAMVGRQRSKNRKR